MLVGHPLFQQNVCPPPSIASVAGHSRRAPQPEYDMGSSVPPPAEAAEIEAVAALRGSHRL